MVSVGTYDELVKQGTEFSSILTSHDKDVEEKEEGQEKISKTPEQVGGGLGINVYKLY